MKSLVSRILKVDRVPLKLGFSEWSAEFIMYFRDKNKNTLLAKFLEILQNARAHLQLMMTMHIL